MKYYGSTISRVLAFALVAGLLAPAATNARVASPQQTVTCASNDMHYHYCRVETGNNVQMRRQMSGSPCTYGRSWGYDEWGIWVDRGCRAEFEVGRDGGMSDGKKAAIIGGIAGAGILAAILAARKGNKNEEYSTDSAPNWMVGSFQGYNVKYDADVEMRIYPDGEVRGRVYGSDSEISGHFRNNRIRIGNLDFNIYQENDGFRLVQTNDRSNEVFYRRVY